MMDGWMLEGLEIISENNNRNNLFMDAEMKLKSVKITFSKLKICSLLFY